jgi:hypothetical protein
MMSGFWGVTRLFLSKSRSILSGWGGVHAWVGAIAAERPLVDAMICWLRASLRSTRVKTRMLTHGGSVSTVGSEQGPALGGRESVRV